MAKIKLIIKQTQLPTCLKYYLTGHFFHRGKLFFRSDDTAVGFIPVKSAHGESIVIGDLNVIQPVSIFVVKPKIIKRHKICRACIKSHTK